MYTLKKQVVSIKNSSGVPNSQEPIAFSKIIIATSVLAGNLPDATVTADDKVYARASYELWKKKLVNEWSKWRKYSYA